jgi:hypothetical protein
MVAPLVVRFQAFSASRVLSLSLAALVLANVAPVAAQTFDAQLCRVVFQHGIHDTSSILSEKQRFEQYQRQLCDARFESYEHLSSAAGKLGFSLPLAKGLLGLDAAAQTSGARFRQAYSNFCSSDFSQHQSSSRYQEHRANINADVLRTFESCVRTHKEAYLKQRGVFAEITLYDQSARFLMKVAVLPRGDFSGVRIDSIQPDGLIKCTYSGQSIRAGQTVINKIDFVLNCTKPKERRIPLLLETNYGSTDVVFIPAYEPQPSRPVQPSIDTRKYEVVFRTASPPSNAGWDVRITTLDNRFLVLVPGGGPATALLPSGRHTLRLLVRGIAEGRPYEHVCERSIMVAAGGGRHFIDATRNGGCQIRQE